MAVAKLQCTFFLLLYLQGNYAQQGKGNNQNVGVNNAISLPQQVLQRTNTPNNVNQIANGGLNINLPQQSNLQPGNLQQPISANLQGNFQQSLNLPANLQPLGASGPLTNLQINKQGFLQLPSGMTVNPSKSQTSSNQFINGGCRENAQMTQQVPPNNGQNMGSTSNVPMSQTQNMPFLSNGLAEIAALKGSPPLLSLFTNQNSGQNPQNPQLSALNFNPPQNQLTDAQKQFLVRSLQSPQCSGQNQPGLNFIQAQSRIAGMDNQPVISVQNQPLYPQQPQIVSTIGSSPPFIQVQAKPLATYLQNQTPQIIYEEEPSMMSLILSELQPNNPQYTVYPYQVQEKKASKSNLKSLIPLIINLLKEKNGCGGCRNCGCPNNGCGNNNVPEPAIFTGYSNQRSYNQGTEEPPVTTRAVEELKSGSSAKEEKNVKNDKKNVVNVDSEEMSDENDSEYADDSEGD